MVMMNLMRLWVPTWQWGPAEKEAWTACDPWGTSSRGPQCDWVPNVSTTYSGSVGRLVWAVLAKGRGNLGSSAFATLGHRGGPNACGGFVGPYWEKFPLFTHLFAMKWWDRMPWSSFSECWALSQLFYSPLSLSSRGFLVPLHFLP